jgi:hypothetical protein
MSRSDEAFLSRWSRRKLDAMEEAAKEEAAKQAAAVPVDNVPPEAPRRDEAPAELPPLESLSPQSDFKPFMDARVTPETRRAALKKLFADARYNVPELFEVYMEDYTKEDPIPAEMLSQLYQSRRLIFGEGGKDAAAARDAPRQTATASPEGEASRAGIAPPAPCPEDPAAREDANGEDANEEHGTRGPHA